MSFVKGENGGLFDDRAADPDALPVCGYAIEISGGPVLRCSRFAHVGRHHSTDTHEFWKSWDEGLFWVRAFETGFRQKMEATECPRRL